MLLVQIPLNGNYWLELHSKTYPDSLPLAPFPFSFLFPHPTLDLHLVWSRNQPSHDHYDPGPPSLLPHIISWWTHLIIVLLSLSYFFLSPLIPFQQNKKSFVKLHLFIDLKFIGVLYLSIHKLLSWNQLHLIVELDCEVLVTVSHAILQWDLSKIRNLFLLISSTSSPSTEDTSILITINNWETTSLHQIKLSPHENDLMESSFDDRGFQYFHPQFSFSSSLRWNPCQNVWKWEIHQTIELEFFKQHLIFLCSIMKKNVNVFPSKSALASPSLHLFLTSLFNSQLTVQPVE